MIKKGELFLRKNRFLISLYIGDSRIFNISYFKRVSMGSWTDEKEILRFWLDGSGVGQHLQYEDEDENEVEK